MADAVVGALRVILGADTAAFENGLKKAGDELGSFGKHMLEIAGGIKLEKIFDEAFHAINEAIFGTIEHLDQLGKAAQKFGIPVEQFSLLAQVASMADVSMETLGKSLNMLSKNMESVGGATKNIAAAAFESMGIAVKDSSGHLKTTNELMLEVADAFAKMQDGATKTALALAIFGRGGSEMIPLLNQGRKGIEEMTHEFAAMGLTVTEGTAKAAEKFNDDLKLLGKTKDAIILKVLGSGGMIQAMTQLSGTMVKLANDTTTVNVASSILSGTLGLFNAIILGIHGAFQQWALDWKLIVDLAKQLTNRSLSGMIDAFQEWKKESKTLNEQNDDLVKNAVGMHSAILPLIDDWQELTKIQNAYVQKAAKPFSEEQFNLGKKFDTMLEDIRLQAIETGGGFNNLAPGFVSAAKGFKDLDGFGKTYGATVDTLSAKQLQLNDALAFLGRMKVTQETLAPWQMYQQQLDKLNATFPTLESRTEAYGIKSTKIALDLATAYGNMAQAIVGPLADAFKTLAAMNKKYAGAAKAFAIAEALVNTYLAATKAYASFAYFPPLAIAAAAAATAAGLANVAKISATQFATGGQFRVGGGMTGVDSKLVAFRATPGEMVDIRRPGQDRGGGATPITLNFSGRGAKDFFASNVRDLVDVLNKAAPDGYVIRMPA